MSTLTETQMQIMLSAMTALIARALGLDGDELREAIRPVWVQAVADILHDQDSCSCQSDGRCFLQLDIADQDLMFPADHTLSLEAFVSMYEDVCRQALGATQA